MTASFTELGLSQELLKAVEDLGFEEPSPIQVLAIPALLTGKDAVGQAQTGTGKTAAFGLPILEKIASGKLNKFYEENCLLQQAFVKDGSVTVEQYMNSAAKALGGSVKFVDAVRFEKGEGIEKKADDFAAEVAAAAGLAK